MVFRVNGAGIKRSFMFRQIDKCIKFPNISKGVHGREDYFTENPLIKI